MQTGRNGTHGNGGDGFERHQVHNRNTSIPGIRDISVEPHARLQHRRPVFAQNLPARNCREHNNQHERPQITVTLHRESHIIAYDFATPVLRNDNICGARTDWIE